MPLHCHLKAPALALAVLLVCAAPGMAREPIALSDGAATTALSEEALRALPATTLDVSFLTSRGQEQARYTGAPLWSVLTQAKLVDPDAHKGLLRRIVIVTGRDGYTLVLSAGELAPELGAKQVLLAYERDGTPLPADKGLRLIVPGDGRGARSVVDVARIDVQTVEKAP
jgi:DMSO/TMAO reductase YedYZ molybdopterin-dependent catalytic subunit